LGWSSPDIHLEHSKLRPSAGAFAELCQASRCPILVPQIICKRSSQNGLVPKFKTIALSPDLRMKLMDLAARAGLNEGLDTEGRLIVLSDRLIDPGREAQFGKRQPAARRCLFIKARLVTRRVQLISKPD
jgi:hypothetical protein